MEHLLVWLGVYLVGVFSAIFGIGLLQAGSKSSICDDCFFKRLYEREVERKVIPFRGPEASWQPDGGALYWDQRDPEAS
jgi:hypothetical protein